MDIFNFIKEIPNSKLAMLAIFGSGAALAFKYLLKSVSDFNDRAQDRELKEEHEEILLDREKLQLEKEKYDYEMYKNNFEEFKKRKQITEDDCKNLEKIVGTFFKSIQTFKDTELENLQKKKLAAEINNLEKNKQ